MISECDLSEFARFFLICSVWFILATRSSGYLSKANGQDLHPDNGFFREGGSLRDKGGRHLRHNHLVVFDDRYEVFIRPVNQTMTNYIEEYVDQSTRHFF